MWGVPVASGVTCGGAFVTWLPGRGRHLLRAGPGAPVGRTLPRTVSGPHSQSVGSNQRFVSSQQSGLDDGHSVSGSSPGQGASHPRSLANSPVTSVRGWPGPPAWPGLEWAAACLPRALVPVHSGCAAGPRKVTAPGTQWREGPSALSLPHALPPTPRPRGGSLLWLQPQPPHPGPPVLFPALSPAGHCCPSQAPSWEGLRSWVGAGHVLERERVWF